MRRRPKPEDLRASALSSMVNAGVPIMPVTRTIVTEDPPDVPRALVKTGLCMSTGPNVDQVIASLDNLTFMQGSTEINDSVVQFINFKISKERKSSWSKQKWCHYLVMTNAFKYFVACLLFTTHWAVCSSLLDKRL